VRADMVETDTADITGTDGTDGSTLSRELDERRDSLVGMIASDIAHSITSGELSPGADLNSVELATRFGTSRTPVREALMLLEKEGLVEIPPRRRPRVAHISITEVEELYEVRGVLNQLMMRRFAEVASDEDLAELRRLLSDAKVSASASEIDTTFALLNKIHIVCLQKCGNASLIRLLGSWKMRMSVTRLVGYSADNLQRAFLDHERLVIALSERDAELASSLILSMTELGLSNIKRHHAALAADATAAKRRFRQPR
jgi:DNA-binding GntR family transcriptional regulator